MIVSAHRTATCVGWPLRNITLIIGPCRVRLPGPFPKGFSGRFTKTGLTQDFLHAQGSRQREAVLHSLDAIWRCAASEGVAALRDKGSRFPSKPRCGTAGLVHFRRWTLVGARRAKRRFASGLDEVPQMRHPQRDSAEKVLANGGRSGYYTRVNLDTGGEEV